MEGTTTRSVLIRSGFAGNTGSLIVAIDSL